MAKPERHHHSHKRSRKQRIIRGILLSAVYLCVLGVIIAMMWQEKAQETEPVGSLEGRFDPSLSIDWNGRRYGYRDHELNTILLIGVDRDTLGDERTIYRSGTQADFMVLLVADRKQQTLTPVQIDRDTMAQVDIYGVLGNRSGTRTTQLCLAQAFGKTVEDNSLNTVSAVSRYLLGIPIDEYFVFDMAFINRFNELIGGVTVTIEDDLTMLDPAMHRGATLHLTGDQAELFVRSRMSVTDGTNASRMKRQRAYMLGVADALHDRVTDGEYVGTLLDGIEGNYASSMNRANVINAVCRYSTYRLMDDPLLPGTHTKGADGFTEFHPDMEGVTERMLSLCFREW